MGAVASEPLLTYRDSGSIVQLGRANSAVATSLCVHSFNVPPEAPAIHKLRAEVSHIAPSIKFAIPDGAILRSMLKPEVLRIYVAKLAQATPPYNAEGGA